MIPIASGVRIWIATGHTDMRRGMHGLARLVQEGLGRDPFAGDVFVFRGRSGSRGREADNAHSRIIPIQHIEIMKISPGGTQRL